MAELKQRNGFDVENQQYYREWGHKKIKIDTINPRKRFSRTILLKYIKKQKNIKNRCEIGCGVGLLSAFLGKKGYKVDAYDLDTNAINLAKSRKPKNVNFYASNVFNIKNKGKYDLVVTNSVIEHIKDDAKAIRNIYSLLRPGGIAIISVPINMKYYTEFDKKWGHYRRYSRKELMEKMISAGFRIKKTRYFAYPLLKWFYFALYLKAAKKRNRIVKKKTMPKYYYLLNIAWPIFCIDFLFNSKKATNIIVIGKKG